jgi:hypothetical protein
MARRKKKIIIDKEAYDMKKRHGRFPMPPPVEVHKDKKLYSRRLKYKKMLNE